MAASAPFRSPHMNWDAPDPVRLMFKSVFKDTDDEEKVSYILLWSGEKGLDMYNSWTFEKEDHRKKPAVIFEKFENQLEQKTSHGVSIDIHYKGNENELGGTSACLASKFIFIIPFIQFFSNFFSQNQVLVFGFKLLSFCYAFIYGS